MISKYKMYLTFNNERSKITLPQLPEKIEVTQGTNNKSVDVVGLGEVVIISDRPAITISFDSVFPSESCDPQANADKIESWIKAKKPVHLIVSGVDINMFCSIENFSYYEQGGDVGSFYYSISLKEYRKPTVRSIKIKKKKAVVQTLSARVDNRIKSKTYTVKSGDCLYNIAKSQLGNANRWKEIASLNGIKSPYYIYSNQVLKLPG
ncbi:LysM peptidoglycan-binding domain-containing protein [Anaerovorax sp. IOR16]|uniref:LysM peptidoglycan-binding domain-containing protein n=1 Tax=Anaerovorax sp. IOR16 TaxID=2773458 RepID=UPI0019D13B1A|nr:LysM peptidoglycan-binding domain-containing protein [Anaerovorax sp. IOR16]